MGDLTAHFSRSEFVCGHCGRLGVPPLPTLLSALEITRAHGYAGRRNGLTVLSGWRCPERQAQLHQLDPDRAARRSQHEVSAAADIEPVLTLAQARALGVWSGIGVEYLGRRGARKAYMVHGDVRHASGHNPTGGTLDRPTVWVYR